MDPKTEGGKTPEITAEFVRENHPDVAAQLVEAAVKEAVASATPGIAEAERTRILAIQALPASGVEALRTELVQDPGVSVDSAARQILEAQGARAAEAGQKFLDARRDAAGASPAPSPSGGDEPSVEETHATRILTAGKPRSAF